MQINVVNQTPLAPPFNGKGLLTTCIYIPTKEQQQPTKEQQQPTKEQQQPTKEQQQPTKESIYVFVVVAPTLLHVICNGNVKNIYQFPSTIVSIAYQNNETGGVLVATEDSNVWSLNGLSHNEEEEDLAKEFFIVIHEDFQQQSSQQPSQQPSQQSSQQHNMEKKNYQLMGKISGIDEILYDEKTKGFICRNLITPTTFFPIHAANTFSTTTSTTTTTRFLQNCFSSGQEYPQLEGERSTCLAIVHSEEETSCSKRDPSFFSCLFGTAQRNGKTTILLQGDYDGCVRYTDLLNETFSGILLNLEQPIVSLFLHKENSMSFLFVVGLYGRILVVTDQGKSHLCSLFENSNLKVHSALFVNVLEHQLDSRERNKRSITSMYLKNHHLVYLSQHQVLVIPVFLHEDVQQAVVILENIAQLAMISPCVSDHQESQFVVLTLTGKVLQLEIPAFLKKKKFQDDVGERRDGNPFQLKHQLEAIHSITLQNEQLDEQSLEFDEKISLLNHATHLLHDVSKQGVGSLFHIKMSVFSKEDRYFPMNNLNNNLCFHLDVSIENSSSNNNKVIVTKGWKLIVRILQTFGVVMENHAQVETMSITFPEEISTLRPWKFSIPLGFRAVSSYNIEMWMVFLENQICKNKLHPFGSSLQVYPSYCIHHNHGIQETTSSADTSTTSSAIHHGIQETTSSAIHHGIQETSGISVFLFQQRLDVLDCARRVQETIRNSSHLHALFACELTKHQDLQKIHNKNHDNNMNLDNKNLDNKNKKMETFLACQQSEEFIKKSPTTCTVKLLLSSSRKACDFLPILLHGTSLVKPDLVEEDTIVGRFLNDDLFSISCHPCGMECVEISLRVAKPQHLSLLHEALLSRLQLSMDQEMDLFRPSNKVDQSWLISPLLQLESELKVIMERICNKENLCTEEWINFTKRKLYLEQELIRLYTQMRDKTNQMHHHIDRQ